MFMISSWFTWKKCEKCWNFSSKNFSGGSGSFIAPMRGFRFRVSRSHWIVRGCGGSKCTTKRGHRELYSKERYIGGLADRLWKVTLVPVTTWRMPCAQYYLYDLPEERHYLSYLPVERAYWTWRSCFMSLDSIRLNSILHISRLRSCLRPNIARKFACNPSRATRHLLPATRHPPPVTRYPPPAIRHPPPVEKYCRLPSMVYTGVSIKRRISITDWV